MIYLYRILSICLFALALLCFTLVIALFYSGLHPILIFLYSTIMLVGFVLTLMLAFLAWYEFEI